MYKAEDYIVFIETGRRDKIDSYGLDLIADRFRELEKSEVIEPSYNNDSVLDCAARKHMFNWNLRRFKRTHPRLYKTIMSAMEAVK